jgi:non-homologous end joining protein Ku
LPRKKICQSLGRRSLDLMTQIVDNLTVDRDLGVFHDGYKERIEAMIKSKMKGEVAQ